MFDSYRLVIKQCPDVYVEIGFTSPSDLIKKLVIIGVVDEERVDYLLHHELWEKYDKEVDRKNATWKSAMYWIVKDDKTKFSTCDLWLYGVHEKKSKNVNKLIFSGYGNRLAEKSWVELTLNEEEKKIWDKLMKRD